MTYKQRTNKHGSSMIIYEQWSRFFHNVSAPTWWLTTQRVVHEFFFSLVHFSLFFCLYQCELFRLYNITLKKTLMGLNKGNGGSLSLYCSECEFGWWGSSRTPTPVSFSCVFLSRTLSFFYLPLAFSLFLRFLLFSSVVFELIFTV